MFPDTFQRRSTEREEPDWNNARDEQYEPQAFAIRRSPFTLQVTLPLFYPASETPRAYLEFDATVSTATRKSARQQIQDLFAAAPKGEECLDLLITDALSQLETVFSSSSLPRAADGVTAPSHSPCRIKRALIWSHHLLSTQKRKDITTWSRTLHLSGFSRPGYPGAIVLEGKVDDVDEFVSRIKGLRWQALQVRGEEHGDARLLIRHGIDIGFKEVEDLSEVVAGLRECDDRLGSWFLEGMKIGHG